MNNKKKFNGFSAELKVLISPLEWGLGHATRCIPIINQLLKHKCQVFIAADGAALLLLKKEFPHLYFLPLPGYSVKLSANKSFFFWKILSQLPKIVKTIIFERRWLAKTIKQKNIDAVISDNRPGLYNKAVVSIYITHQVAIKTGNFITSKIAKYVHHYFISKYNECWVPDHKDESLAGDLSHPTITPANVKYIGALSRFEKLTQVEKKYDLIILLSGPEPQRTILENILLKDLLFYEGKTLMVRGLPGKIKDLSIDRSTVEIVNYLAADDLCIAIQQSEVVISRSGYTTVMDLVKLRKQAIFIATPGQTEQEYLARYLKQQRMFFSVSQQNFKLRDAMEKFADFKSYIPVFDMNQYKLVVKEFVDGIRYNSKH